MLLINRSIIAQYMQVANSQYDDTLNEHIRDAQESDVRKLMGDKLYFSFLRNINDTRFQDILLKKEYLDPAGYIRISYGIQCVLAYYAMARYYYWGQTTDTPFGFRIKDNEFSRQPYFQEIKSRYIEKQQLAREKWETVADFLRKNSTIYPEYSCAEENSPRSFFTVKNIK